MVQVTDNTEFIIGIDFDNEKTSASFYSLKTQECFDIDILPGLKVIKSAVAILEQEGRQTICVGESAIQNAPYSKDFQIAFKKRPSEMNTIERDRMVAFMRGVYAEILNQHPGYKAREHVIYIACHLPYRLLKNEESDYLKIFEDAGLPIAGIQTKAVAAYFYEERQPASIFRSKGGILIADFASKYTGFTYFNCHMFQRIEDVYQFGMSEIEELLLEYAMLHPQDPYMTEFAEHYGNHKESKPYNQILFAFRKAKEEFYANKLPIFIVLFDYSNLTSAGNFPINGFGGISIPRAEVESILKGFIGHMKNAVKAFKNNILGNENITSCVLIGEGSCMDFVHNILMDVFHLDEKQCSACERTSLISQGVAYKAYNDIKYPRSFNVKFYNNNNMKQITPNTEFIIGIDFGHGETSAAVYSLKTQECSDIDILPGLKVIKSAVAILEQEGRQTICVGESAIQNAPYSKDFQIAFKKRPSEMNTIERDRMVAFMRGVYAEILNQHPDYKTREHVVYIARPSQDIWDSEEKAYLQIAEEAGLPVAGIQKESRAAYFRARTQPDAKIDGQVKNGVLIVDYGSSTIDFTYINSHLSKPIDDGCPLGASEVERLLLEYAMSNPQDANMAEFAECYGYNKESSPYNQLLFAFRKAKEEFYSNKYCQNFSVGFDYDDLTITESFKIEGSGRFRISKDKVNEVLGKNKKRSKGYSYIENVKKAVISFKENKLKGNKVACVYLTGGASRMDFVREIFMEIFDLDDSHCPSDDNPSLIVSQGVAHLSYADIKGIEREKELKRLAESAISDYNWEMNFREIINKSIKEKIIAEAYNVMIEYKENGIAEYLTLKDDYTTTNPKEYINMQPGKTQTGLVKVRNIRSLYREFEAKFTDMIHYDFASICESSISENIINSVISQLNTLLGEFQYDSSKLENKLKLNGLSAKITANGAKLLSNKFTGEGDGHIIYDAVKSCYPGGIMIGWNLHKDRWDSDRKQHYEYYRNHYKNIYTSSEWDNFLKNYIIILGIESAKKQTKDYLDKLIDDYVSYAKLAIFFK